MDSKPNPRARKLYTSPEKKAEWKARRPYRGVGGSVGYRGPWRRRKKK